MSGMELVVAPIVSVAVEEAGRPLCCSIYSTIKNIVRGPQQLDLLESSMNSLRALRNDVKRDMISAERDGKVIKEQATVWVGEVDKLQRKYDQIQEASSSRSFLSCISKRYGISTKVAEHLREIQRLQKEGSSLARSVAFSYPVEHTVVEHIAVEHTAVEHIAVEHTAVEHTAVEHIAVAVEHTAVEHIAVAVEHIAVEHTAVEHIAVEHIAEVKAVEYIPEPSIKYQTASVSEDLAKVMLLLSEDKNGIIGIWGMGGVGKTNLVRNLNNKLLEINSNMHFSCVLWVTVSKNLDIKRLQMRIASRLGLNLKESSGAEGMANQLRERLLKEERFLLILDDVWEKIDLDKLGVPRPGDHRGCKIILTSRSLEVCRNMMLTDDEVKISVLRDEDAWQLFSRYTRDVVSSEHITLLAEAICRECKGLPLAIITVGAAMRGKTNPEVWKHALNQLRRSVPCVPGVEEELYKPLKWSYDSLEGKYLKTCFLYCSLFPEDVSIGIDELVWYWLAEGLIDDREKYEDFYSRGISLIENLKDACLLEDGSYEGTVKMHDVVRDVSIWIASSKSLVRSGNGLKEISATELSKSLKRVSLMNNDLERLPDDSVIQCLEASTLFLQYNRRLDLIPERFLEGFEALRVLNISGTSIKLLPDTLLRLYGLRALLLNGCWDLEDLPPLERLSRLQVLDLSGSGIRKLPRGLEQLSNLRHLNLRGTYRLEAVQAGVISKLSSLEVLDVNMGYIWKVKGGVNEEEACIDELQCLEQLQVLSIALEWIPSHRSQDTIISLTNRLKAFQIVIGDLPDNILAASAWGGQRCVIMCRIDLSGGQIRYWLSNASYLYLRSCRGVDEMLQDLVINSVDSFTYLKKLLIWGSESSFRTGGSASQNDLLPNLEELHLIQMTGVESISKLVKHLGLRFQRLKKIVVIACEEMKYLLSLGNSIRTMPNLEEIGVSGCSNLEELFNYLLLEINMVPYPITPKLQKLKLDNLPKLRNLCRDEKTWPGTDVQVDVTKCDLLSTEQ